MKAGSILDVTIPWIGNRVRADRLLSVVANQVA
jgi:hypothetical protein